jgi:hypothetical protein
MLDAFFTGLFLVFEWPAIGYLFLGVYIGIWLGAVPGLGGIIGLFFYCHLRLAWSRFQLLHFCWACLRLLRPVTQSHL